MVPVIITAEVMLAVAELTPPVTPVLSSRVPEVTLRVTVRVPRAASTSLIDRPEMASAVSSSVAGGAGRALIGASLTALIRRVIVRMSVRLPPEPVLPRSSTSSERATSPFWSSAGWTRTPSPARVALSSARSASSCTVPVPLPVMAPGPTPPTMPGSTVIAPDVTASVRRTAADPESTSVTLTELTIRSLSSRVVSSAGALRTGASLTAVIVSGTAPEMVRAVPAPLPPRSLTLTCRLSLPLMLRFG